MPFKTIQQVVLAWGAIADQYRAAGNKKKALELKEDLHEHLAAQRSLEDLKQRYYEHLRHWNEFCEAARKA